jgi:hypothetical protein
MTPPLWNAADNGLGADTIERRQRFHRTEMFRFVRSTTACPRHAQSKILKKILC